MKISIHAPRVGSDSAVAVYLLRSFAFQSTLPVWGATAWNWYEIDSYAISIHAPRVGSDLCRGSVLAAVFCISIHAPRVGSDYFIKPAADLKKHFNPRSPCGERPRSVQWPSRAWSYFNPRSPCGERLKQKRIAGQVVDDFNPRSPCGERPVSLR